MNKYIFIAIFAFISLDALSNNNDKNSLPMIQNINSKYDAVKTIGMSDCKWDQESFWGRRFKLCEDVMVPNMWNLLNDPKLSHIYENFLVASGTKKGVFKGFLFSDGDFYKYVEAMCYLYAIDHSEMLDKKMDEIISVIAKAQRQDGYVTTGKIIGKGTMMNFDHTQGGALKKEEIFTADRDHEFYNFGHLFTTACIHYRVTGKRNLLDVAIKAADFLYKKFINPSPQLASLHWNAPHFMGLVELYRTTNDKRYLDLAKSFIYMLGTTKQTASGRGLDHSQKRIPFFDETKAVGHAVHANYLYCGIADYIAETGDAKLKKALLSVWDDAINHKMYITGATGSNNRSVSHEGIVGEAYGQDYELPNSRGYSETCANIGNAMWNWRMFLESGDAKYMDIVELALYNSVLSGISLDGKHFYYQNPTRFINDFKSGHFSGQARRSSYLKCFCCLPNVVRTIAAINNYAYSLSDNSLFVNLYGSNNLKTKFADGNNLSLTQVSNYPWDGNIDITINEISSEKEYAFMFRIPQWCDGAMIMVNNKKVSDNITNGEYYKCIRKWKKNDRIRIILPMDAKIMEGHPYIEDITGQVAIKRGPIVYCLESIDLPKNSSISNVCIPVNIKLKEKYNNDFLFGIVSLRGDILLKKGNQWDDMLYKPFVDKKAESHKATFIPYYSWGNRELSDMSVWFPASFK